MERHSVENKTTYLNSFHEGFGEETSQSRRQNTARLANGQSNCRQRKAIKNLLEAETATKAEGKIISIFRGMGTEFRVSV